MPDQYSSVQEVLAAEAEHVSIIARAHAMSRLAVLAPHAGRIEPMTGEIALAVAGREHRVYCFQGRAPVCNAHLHVNSVRFDEQRLAEVLRGVIAVLSIHGAMRCGRAVTFIGGRNTTLASLIAEQLAHAGFSVEEAPARLAGRHPRNIVNRVPLAGAQLELSWDLRRQFRDQLEPGSRVDGARLSFDRYVELVRSALETFERLYLREWEAL